MASEMRRVAQALVATRSESFASRYPLQESMARVKAALDSFHPRRLRLESAWTEEPAGVRLEARFVPASGTRTILSSTSALLTLLIAASAWAIAAADADGSARFLVPLVTAFAILAFPLLVVALGSQREAEEALLRRSIHKALVAEEELSPPPRSDFEGT
jgi:hypothetical protein